MATLPPGTQIGGYQIIAPLGAGGMGEVYRAHDTRLQRDVAIKVLPPSSASDAGAIARLQSEARAASALNHPHILTIYDIGAMDSCGCFIAMELVEGETLRSRIGRNDPLEVRVDYLIQIGDGLAKAHMAGIVHRDLKPENVMINSDGFAKILDFGLAKQASARQDDATEVMPLTGRGLVVGTLGYLAPEQLRGEPADACSDIFAFGCVAYEVLSRQRAFTGLPVEDPPALRTVDPALPVELQRVVSRCLARSCDERYRSMREVVAELRAILDAILHPKARAIARPVQITFAREVEQFPAISHDGTRIVFSREAGKIRQLVVQTVSDDCDETQITSDEYDAIQPAWSPDGQRILFVRGRRAGERIDPSDVFGRYTGGDIYAIDVESHQSRTVINDAANPAWSPDGKHIAFDASWSGQRRIWIADERGRNPQQLTTDTSEAVHHVRPRWSPDGKRIVFQTLEGPKFNTAVVNVASKVMHHVTDDYIMDVHPVWSDAIYFSSYRSGGMNVWRIPVDDEGVPAGAMEQVTAGPGHDVDLDVSPAGRLVFAIMSQNADIWRLPVDPATGAVTGEPESVIASTRENSRGAWSPDGSMIAFNSNRGGEMNIHVRFGGGKTKQLTRGSGGDYQASWSQDARSLVFFSGRSGALEIWRVDVEGQHLTQLTTEGGININPFCSPDGTRIAYQSDRDGRLELWVMNADGSNRRQLTTCGVTGHFVRWIGERILFRSTRGEAMTVSAAGGEPEPFAKVPGGAHMSLSPDLSMVMDVVAHRTLWVTPVSGGESRRVYEFADADSRIDYPVWSPDGRWVLFDRFVPRAGNVWMLDL